MSVHVSSWVWDHSKSTLGTRLVALALADRSDTETGKCYPSIDEIAKRCGISRACVFTCITKLKEAGELTVNPRMTGKGQTSSMYCFIKYLDQRRGLESGRGGVQSLDGGGLKSGPSYITEPSIEPSGKTDVLLEGFSSSLKASKEFVSAWRDWITHRKEIKKTITATARKEQIKFLEAKGDPALAAACLRQSMMNGWQGLFDLKVNGTNGNGTNGHSKPSTLNGSNGGRPFELV